MRQWYEVDGKVVPPGKLVRTAAGWVEPVPVRCPAGHRLRVESVGWIPCSAPDRGGHRVHRCECGGTVLTPPLDEPVCACEERSRARPQAR